MNSARITIRREGVTGEKFDMEVEVSPDDTTIGIDANGFEYWLTVFEEADAREKLKAANADDDGELRGVETMSGKDADRVASAYFNRA